MSKSKKLKFQLLSENEIKYATASAHLAMSREAQAQQDNCPPCIFEHPERDQGFRESSMRSKQISKRVDQIKAELTHLRKMSKTQKGTVFVPPLVLETMNKRWNGYCCSARRALFNLRREINQLNDLISSRDPNMDKFMRKVSLSVRSILMLLQGLTKYGDRIHPGGDGRSLYFEVVETAKNILKLSSAVGIVTSYHKPNDQTDTSFTESSMDNPSKSLILESSDLNSEVMNVIAPENVRKNLTNLVSGNGKKRGKTKNTRGASPVKTEPKSLLSREKPFEELPDGRRIQLVQDSLSPILKQKAILDAQSKSVRFQPRDALTKEKRPYGNAEKMADAVFEQMLPHIKESRAKNKNASVQEDFTVQIANLLKRLTILEEKRKRHVQYLNDISHSSSSLERRPSNVEEVIGAANQSLFEASRLGFTSPQAKPQNVQPPETLAVVKHQKEEFWASLVANNYLPSGNPDAKNESQVEISRPETSSPEARASAEHQCHASPENQTHETSFNPQTLTSHSEPAKQQITASESLEDRPNTFARQLKDESGSKVGSQVYTGDDKIGDQLDKEIVTSAHQIDDGDRNTDGSDAIPEQVQDSISYESTSANSEVLESSNQFFDSNIEST